MDLPWLKLQQKVHDANAVSRAMASRCCTPCSARLHVVVATFSPTCHPFSPTPVYTHAHTRLLHHHRRLRTILLRDWRGSNTTRAPQPSSKCSKRTLLSGDGKARSHGLWALIKEGPCTKGMHACASQWLSLYAQAPYACCHVVVVVACLCLCEHRMPAALSLSLSYRLATSTAQILPAHHSRRPSNETIGLAHACAHSIASALPHLIKPPHHHIPAHCCPTPPPPPPPHRTAHVRPLAYLAPCRVL
jgi:hypothetical protein